MYSVSIATLSAGARGVIDEMLEDVRLNPRYQDMSPDLTELEPGEYRHNAKGGFWNDNALRAPYGITKADVTRCRKDLKAIGTVLSFDDVDALLLQGLMGFDGTLYPMKGEAYAIKPSEDPRQYAVLKVRRRRDEARAGGYCTVCLNPEQKCAVKSDGTTASTCYDCGKKANDRRLAKAKPAARAARKAKLAARKKAKVRK